MNRRARQTKAPKGSSRNSIMNRDLEKSLTWNTSSMSDPTYSHIDRFDNRPYTIQQTQQYGTVLNTNTSIPSFFSKSFALSDLSQQTTLTAAFDQYRIDWIKIKVVPQTLTIGSYGLANWYSVLDYDDANTASLVSQLLQYQNCITTSTTTAHFRHLTPHIAVAAYSGAFTSFKNEVADWIDSSSPSVQHYGLKIGVDAVGTNFGFAMYATFQVSFRNVF